MNLPTWLTRRSTTVTARYNVVIANSPYERHNSTYDLKTKNELNK